MPDTAPMPPQAPPASRSELAPAPSPRAPRNRSAQAIVGALAAGALLGAAVLAAILLTSGAFDHTSTTVTLTTASPAPASSTTARAPSAIYAAASAGVVDVTSHVTATVETPFGRSQESGTEIGSGSILDRKGHILTAQHVVANASSVSVKLLDGTTRKARVVGYDTATDAAILKIDATGLTLHPIALGSVRTLAVGDPVYAIGDPFGFARSLSGGLVSALDRTIEAPNGFQVAHAIQTDAALNPGNSGGPILDGRGRLVGVADQIATGGSDATTSTGVGFAVAVDTIASVLPQMERGVTPLHAYLGTSVVDGASGGAVVRSVVAGGPAAKGGLAKGDRIVAIDGVAIDGAGALVAALASHQPGDHVTITVRRGSAERTLRVSLTRQPARASTS
jgi:putative serine protease PepD